jgi:hypothetical protein
MRDIPAARAVAQELEREVLVLLIGRGGRVRLLVCGVPVGATLTLRDGAGVTALRLPIDATWPWSVDWPVALLFVASDFVVASLDRVTSPFCELAQATQIATFTLFWFVVASEFASWTYHVDDRASLVLAELDSNRRREPPPSLSRTIRLAARLQ